MEEEKENTNQSASISNSASWEVNGNHQSIFDNSGTTYGNPTYIEPNYNRYQPPILMNIYSELAENFGLDLTEEQVGTLNDLFNSGDENNRVIAANMFKYLLFKDKEDEH